MEPVVEIKSITSFRSDPDNANVGTERGAALLDKSVSTDGAGRSLLATKDGVIIAGNKTQQALIDQGIEEVIVVHTDGTRAVIVQRDDVEHGTERAQRMAVYDNRSSEIGLDWSPEMLSSLDIDLTEMFFDSELTELGVTEDMGLPTSLEDPGIEGWGEMKDRIIILFAGNAEREECFTRLDAEEKPGQVVYHFSEMLRD